MATIQKVKRKKGFAFVAIINKKGVKSFSKTFKKAGDARAWADRIESDQQYLDARGLGSQASTTLTQLLRQFESQYRKKDHCLIGKLKYWETCLGDYRLYDISQNIIKSEISVIANTPVQLGNGRSFTKDDTAKRKRSNGTVNSYKAALSSLFKYAVQQRIVDSNPCIGIASLPIDNKRTRFLTAKELSDLLTACKASEWKQLYLLVLMAVTSGARQGELLGLRWKYINLKTGIAHLPDTKNGDARDLALTEPVIAGLRKIQGIGDALVFASEVKPSKPFEFRKHWEKALLASGVEIGQGKDKFVFHSLRHTAASYLTMNNVSLVEVAKILGHKSHTTTLRYAHLTDDHKKKVVDSVMGDIK